jgi:RNA polymerase sigma factor for flagellar operon FliA
MNTLTPASTDQELARFERRPRRVAPGSAIEEKLLHKHLPLVKATVGRLLLSLPRHVDVEDLYSAGVIGLLNAIRHFNPKSGTTLETYARVRIRGAVLDELRRTDWVPRSVHGKARKVQAVMNELEQAKGEAPSDEEMAKALKISVADYRQWLEEIRPTTFVCLDAAPNNENEDGWSHSECLPDQSQEDPMAGAARRELAGIIAERLELLPEMQRKVLALYYFEDLRLREIAEAVGLTESRICQIHAQAILAIKAHLQNLDLCPA